MGWPAGADSCDRTVGRPGAIAIAASLGVLRVRLQRLVNVLAGIPTMRRVTFDAEESCACHDHLRVVATTAVT